MLKELLPLIPKHTCYAEAFAGGLALLMAKEPSSVEVVNDLNKDLVILYRQAQYHLDALLQEIEWTLIARENLKDFKTNRGLTELQIAARFFVRNRSSFGGGMHSYAVAKAIGGGAGNRDLHVELLIRANKRLAKVSVENLPYERFLENYDSAETFFFMDPPYIGPAVGTYDPWTEKDMQVLCKRLGKLKGQWVLTVNDSEFTRELFRAHKIKGVKTKFNRGKANTKEGGELIIQPK